jgi:GT2 family glycosyltransferase
MTEVSVVIPTCGRAGILRGTLEGLLRQRLDPGRMEVLVVADGGDPETLSLIRGLASSSPVRLEALAQERQGQGQARNRGIERAAGRIVLMLDDDILAVPGLVAAHLAWHEGREDTVVTGALPVERLAEEPAHIEAVRLWWDGELCKLAEPEHRPAFRDFVTGNVSVPRSALRAAGGFDPAFTGYGREDYELGHRLLGRGLRFVHEPQAVGLHRYRKPVLEWVRQFRGTGRADVIFARKHPRLAGEVMTLSPFPRVPWDARAVAASEQVVTKLNRMGGRIWEGAAGVAQAAWYWRGIEEEVRSRRELDWLIQAREAGRAGRPAPEPTAQPRLPLLRRLLPSRRAGGL